MALEELLSQLGLQLTDEQKEKFTAGIDSELDKARTQASKTARKNAEKEIREKVEADAQAAIEAQATAKAQEILKSLTQTEEEKLEDVRKQLENDRKALETDRKKLAVEAKFKANGYTDDEVSTLSQLFIAGQDVAACESMVDRFLEGQTARITAKVDEAKAALTNSGTPPQGAGTGTPGAKQLNESQILDSIYAKVSEEGFVNNHRNNLALDVAAITALDAAAAQPAQPSV